MLKNANVERVFCVGLAYDYCVGSTALDAVQRGFETFVVMDGTRSVADTTATSMSEKLENAGVKSVLISDIALTN